MSDQKKKQDGGPAFPSNNAPGEHRNGVGELLPCAGMSLRDYFAGQALDRLNQETCDRIAAPEAPMSDEIDDSGHYVVPAAEVARRIAASVYLIADAMLKARDE